MCSFHQLVAWISAQISGHVVQISSFTNEWAKVVLEYLMVPYNHGGWLTGVEGLNVQVFAEGALPSHVLMTIWWNLERIYWLVYVGWDNFLISINSSWITILMEVVESI